jgi:hypothetical protein
MRTHLKRSQHESNYCYMNTPNISFIRQGTAALTVNSHSSSATNGAVCSFEFCLNENRKLHDLRHILLSVNVLEHVNRLI